MGWGGPGDDDRAVRGPDWWSGRLPSREASAPARDRDTLAGHSEPCRVCVGHQDLGEQQGADDGCGVRCVALIGPGPGSERAFLGTAPVGSRQLAPVLSGWTRRGSLMSWPARRATYRPRRSGWCGCRPAPGRNRDKLSRMLWTNLRNVFRVARGLENNRWVRQHCPRR